MGIWSSLKSALGLASDPEVHPLEPLTVSEGAVARLSALPADHGIAIELLPNPAGVVVQVTEVPGIAEGHPELDELPVRVTDDDLARLVGLELHHDGERWQVTADVAIRARETPNPDSRLYLTSRILADGRLFFGPGARGTPWLADQLLGRDEVSSLLIRDHTLTIERTPDADWDAIDAAVAGSVRQHVLAAGRPLSPDDVPPRDDPLEQAVWRILEARVLPALHRDGGDLELLGIDDEGVVRVHLIGACRSCPASVLTLKGGIERTLLDAFPGEIERVEAVG